MGTTTQSVAINEQNKEIDFVCKVCDELHDEASKLNKILDGVQIGLSVVGMIPVVGEVADGISDMISDIFRKRRYRGGCLIYRL